ncbi:MAG: GNAT family N-acetyltransferase [Chloroflexota bacterium]
MKVKICGIKTLEEAQAAVEAGADMLGFNFFPKSPRFVSPDACAAITAALAEQGSRTTFVGVFVNAPIAGIRRVVAHCNLHRVQLAGDEPPEVLSELGGMAFKAIRPKDADEAVAALRRYLAASQAPAYLMDASVVGEYGGTGKVADWSLARSLASKLPILLAGGLTPANVRSAVSLVRPWGVDVASGVESAPGVKDMQKMRTFIQAARTPIKIDAARRDDLATILALQKLAYQSEAELYDDPHIPALLQTLDDLQQAYERMLFLKAVAGKKIVGSVRAEAREGTCYIGKLIVHPDWQGQGIGTSLLEEIEHRFSGNRYEIFTGDLSKAAIRLYQKHGYTEFRREPLSPMLTLVYLEKKGIDTK